MTAPSCRKNRQIQSMEMQPFGQFQCSKKGRLQLLKKAQAIGPKKRLSVQ